MNVQALIDTARALLDVEQSNLPIVEPEVVMEARTLAAQHARVGSANARRRAGSAGTPQREA